MYLAVSVVLVKFFSDFCFIAVLTKYFVLMYEQPFSQLVLKESF